MNFSIYNRNHRVLNTTVTEIPGSRQKINWHMWNIAHFEMICFLITHGKFLPKMLLHLKVAVNIGNFVLSLWEKNIQGLLLLTSLYNFINPGLARQLDSWRVFHCHIVTVKKIWLQFFKVHIWATSCQNQQNGMCAQQRLRSAWASAQSDQSPRCLHEGSLDP